MITSSEIRTKYLEFFKSKNHQIIPSASLVPANDPTVLFTTAGMHPLVPYLLGEKHPLGVRLANAQKCIRTGDIDEVGDNTHLTFFEMLGNWSLGDYFKKEAISWSFEFLTDKKWLGLPLDKLAFTCFEGDQNALKDTESAEIWMSLGVSKERIAFLPVEDNWWGPAGQTGPCGPDSEMFYWTEDSPAPDIFDPKDRRWIEIWNDVFMQYNKTTEGIFEKLPKPNVDTGMGLERILIALNAKKSVYETDLFLPIVQKIESLTNTNPLVQHSVLNKRVSLDLENKGEKIRIIADHARASSFIIADGVEPSNKDRGYVLRKLLRRAIVLAKQLNIKEDWFNDIFLIILQVFNGAYPELETEKEKILNVFKTENQKFGETLEKGLKEFEKFEKVDAKIAFNLYQSYGFPLELTLDLAKQKNQDIDYGDFEKEFNKHKELSRTASAGVFKGGLADHSEIIVKYHTATHLLNAALREVLGNSVVQKGSNITNERTRFDFSCQEKMSDEQKQKVENLVNDWILKDLEVKNQVMSKDEAQKLGAIGAFGEKYGQTVSVYTIVDKDGGVISREFCGGPHVEHTAVLGHFRITKEEAVASGIRRIKAVLE